METQKAIEALQQKDREDREHYDNKFLADTLHLMRDMLSDLEDWSVHNDDQFNEEITQLEAIIQNIQAAPTSAKELEDPD